MELFEILKNPIIRIILMITAVPIVLIQWIRYIDGLTGWWQHGDLKQKIKVVILAVSTLTVFTFLVLQVYKW